MIIEATEAHVCMTWKEASVPVKDYGGLPPKSRIILVFADSLPCIDTEPSQADRVGWGVV